MTSYVADRHDIYPFSAVVHIRATFPSGEVFTGSGVMVGPNDVLTAAHVVYDTMAGGVAESVVVTPALDGLDAPFGAFNTATINYYPIDDDGDGLILDYESETDFAVLGLNERVGDTTGVFGLDPDPETGSYNVTGYPGAYETHGLPRMTNEYGLARADHDTFTLGYIDIETHPGSSGGPLWQEVGDGGTPLVAGVVSTSGWAGSVEAQYDVLLEWIAGNDDLIGDPAEEDTPPASAPLTDDPVDDDPGGSVTDGGETDTDTDTDTDGDPEPDPAPEPVFADWFVALTRVMVGRDPVDDSPDDQTAAATGTLAGAAGVLAGTTAFAEQFADLTTRAQRIDLVTVSHLGLTPESAPHTTANAYFSDGLEAGVAVPTLFADAVTYLLDDARRDPAFDDAADRLTADTLTALEVRPAGDPAPLTDPLLADVLLA